MRLTKLFIDFFDSEKAGGLILICATAISLVLANSNWQTEYISFWDTTLGEYSILHWINDGLMTIFFLLIGLELEREVYRGELSKLQNAALPIFAALGGMIVPVIFFLALNYGTETQQGAGIPMATDIAFAIGILSLLGSRVPSSLKVFLTALAVMDDLGAIIIISIFYTSSIVYLNLFIAFCVFGFLFLLNRLKIYNLLPYLFGGIAMWYFMYHSGVHATITGFLLAFVVPFGDGTKKSSSFILQSYLHKPVAFLILPLFALANTCISIDGNWQNGLSQLNSLGIIIGLVIGKPLGVFLFSFFGISLGLCTLPSDMNWKNILGTGFLAGIGFTMSIFITLLAFENFEFINNSKIAIIFASLIAGVLGYLWLLFSLKPKGVRSKA